MRYRKKIGWMILAGLAFASLMALVTMYLWNWLVPALFAGPEITFLQTVGILILSKILFGFGKGSWKSKYRRGHRANLSMEEKELLKRKFMDRCGWTDKRESESTDEAENKDPS